ncbi:glycosyltransferase [Macrococcoides bohemicum]|uniref:glycosyltransferase n=1 Tax=Macrococcoides bohemicum TaxID=1903056 RepID=UPI001C5E0718|nr:glycosyltransferase [Macrococcus bohemicus]QYA44586.1 glycosyltransferase [Macrococcus bohemicus]
MKIVSIPRWYPTLQNPNNGIFFKEQNELLNNASDIDIEVLYVEIPSISRYFKKKVFNNKIIETSVRTRYFVIPRIIPRIKWIQEQTHYFATLYLFKRYIENNGKPDIIHAHVSIISGQTALRLGKKYTIPVVITEHHSVVIDNKKTLRKMKKIIESADSFITVSEFLKKKLEMNNIEVIPNFIKEEIKPYNGKLDDFTIITVSNLTPNKNTKLLIDAVDLVNKEGLNVKLKIIGNGPLLAEYYEYIHNNNIQNIVFMNQMNNSEVIKEISKSNILVSTSKIETFGVSILEAISVGVPVISTNSGGPLDIVNDINGIILKSDDPYELANVIISFYNDEIKFNKNNILKDYHLRFSSNKITNKYYKLYKKLSLE